MGWTIIEHKSAPASDMFDFTGLTLGSYQRVVVLFDELTVGTDGAFVVARLSTASTLRTSGYRYRTRGISSGNNTDDSNDAAATSVRLIGGSSSAWGIGNAANKSGSGKVEIANLGSGLYKLVLFDGVAALPSGNMARYTGGGVLEQTGAIDGIRLFLSTGTLTAGKATLYGLTTS